MEQNAAPNDGSTLLVCMFHTNLAFSSLEEERQPEIVERCYWPMLRLAESTPFPIAFEAPAWTLERIADIDPDWIAEARRLIAAGRAELVGSSYSQAAAPLLPADVNRWNIRLGLDAYAELLDARPRLALVCEQAYSPGLVPLYREAGYEGFMADWDNAFRSNPDWGPEVRRHPQRAVGAGGGTMPVVWSESIAFQKFQRYAHREMDLDPYVQFVSDTARPGGAFVLYANDAEIFDNRPGRFAAEPVMGEREWDRIAEALNALSEQNVGVPSLPGDVLSLLDRPGAGQELRLESPEHPVPVKKQDKYNISRWAVSGRDDIGINTRCWRIYDGLRQSGTSDPAAWRELCELWASDLRTHITDSRWERARPRLEKAERSHAVAEPAPREVPANGYALPGGVEHHGRLWRVRAGVLDIVLNARRGLSIESFADSRLGGDVLFGTLEHGYFADIALGADWYTGNLVHEAPLRHKVTDLEPMEPRFASLGDGRIGVWGQLETELGPIEKVLTIDGNEGTIEVETTVHWDELPAGSLRAGHLTMHPEAFELDSLFYAAHNGGPELEYHSVAGHTFDHGQPVSALVSCRQGIGATEGLVLMGDASRTVQVQVDQSVCNAMALVGITPAGDRWFFRMALSVAESDDTRRGGIPRNPAAPQRVRYTLRATRTVAPGIAAR